MCGWHLWVVVSILKLVQVFQQALPSLQVATDELMKEVENSIAEFKRSKQEYDEERVQEQVRKVEDLLKRIC